MWVVIFASFLASPPEAEDLLPDVIVWEQFLADAYIGTTFSSEPPAGRRAIRMSTCTANKGLGRLELRGGPIVGNSQLVYQRIYRTDGTFWDRPAGSFTYHASHSHIHFDDWTVFRLRLVTPEGGVGEVIRTGQKTSFCIIELRTYDSTIPGYNTAPAYNSCGQIQGLRPGRADVYSSGLTDQYIDIEGVPDGIYWLEAEVDPDNNVLESDETNNVARILFTIGPPPQAVPDAYEENDSIAQVNQRPEGGVNSPNLGLLTEEKQIDFLSMEDNNDYFKFRTFRMGTAGDYISIQSPYTTVGNLNLQLYNESGQLLDSSTTSYNYEYISLRNRPAGTYFARVYGTNNPRYLLTINPAGNLPPEVQLLRPLGTVWVERAIETVEVEWISMDPEGDPKWVSLFIDRQPVSSSTNIPLEAYQNMPGDDFGCNINTAEMPLGKWYLKSRATGGGAFMESWAPGEFVVYKKGDVNLDDLVDEKDWVLAITHLSLARRLPPGWEFILDMNRDGKVDRQDVAILYDIVFNGNHH